VQKVDLLMLDMKNQSLTWMITPMLRYLKFFDYYLEIFAKSLSGRGLMNPAKNGEYAVLEGIVKNNKDKGLCFVDGGSNVGEHVKQFDLLCKKYKVVQQSIYAVEPFPSTIEVLKKNLANISFELVERALGKEEATIQFFSEAVDGVSGQNSAIKHYYLSSSIDVTQTTIDSLVGQYNLEKIDFLKLDIEGYEYNALLGANQSMTDGLIDYIQLEYNQTWIEGGGTIQKVLELAQKNAYTLYRIRANDLLSMPKYNFNLDDFFYSNLLLVRDGCALPLPCKRKVIPII
jgi:FkbM family methyltransferase